LPGGLRQATVHPAAGLAPVSGVFPAGSSLHLLEIRLQAIQLSPCHADLSAHHPIRLGVTAGFLACCCPHIPFGSGLAIRSRDIPPISPRLAGDMKTAPRGADGPEGAPVQQCTGATRPRAGQRGGLHQGAGHPRRTRHRHCSWSAVPAGRVARCGICGRRLESCWANDRPAYRCRHGNSSAVMPDPGRPKNACIREDRILPHLPALHTLLTSAAPSAGRRRRRTRRGTEVSPRVSEADAIGYLRSQQITLRSADQDHAGRHRGRRDHCYRPRKLTSGRSAPAKPKQRRAKGGRPAG
jgi:hypothetical protein